MWGWTRDDDLTFWRGSLEGNKKKINFYRVKNRGATAYSHVKVNEWHGIMEFRTLTALKFFYGSSFKVAYPRPIPRFDKREKMSKG